MAAEAPTKPKRETWRDWLPAGSPDPAPETLLTRDEVVETLERRRVDASVRDLRFWEAEGVLPRPIRRSHKGAVRAVYPDWYPHLVRQVRRLQRWGMSLEQIKRRTRAYARYVLGVTDDPDNPIDAEIREHAMGLAIEGPEDVRLPETMVEELRRVARWHERLTGQPTDHVEVWVIDEEGAPTLYPWPISPTTKFYASGPPHLTPIHESVSDVVD